MAGYLAAGKADQLGNSCFGDLGLVGQHGVEAGRGYLPAFGEDPNPAHPLRTRAGGEFGAGLIAGGVAAKMLHDARPDALGQPSADLGHILGAQEHDRVLGALGAHEPRILRAVL